MMQRIYIVVLIFFLGACKLGTIPADSASEGTIHISVDETFKPIIEEQIRVYQSTYPNAKIIAEYKPEAECWKDLMHDSTRLVIVTKKLTDAESAYYYDSLKLYPESGLLAFDAVALIVNRSAPDSVFSAQDVQGLLQGTSSLPYKLVFDGVKATSTVRFAIDSILKGKTMKLDQVTAARSSWEVVQYIAQNPGYVGFVGVSWIGNPEDTAQVAMQKKVRIAWLPCKGCDDGSYLKPWQEEILTNRYPYRRGIFYVIKENYTGLGKSFINFMKSDRGQLIFRRGYLVPAWRAFIVRETKLKLVPPVKQ
ncbi:MAG: substrate-binding domain-containing protein [Chitinophagaceae bacterium]